MTSDVWEWRRFPPPEETEALWQLDRVESVALSAVGIRPTSAKIPLLKATAFPPPPSHSWVHTRNPALQVVHNDERTPVHRPRSEIPRQRRTVV